MFRAARNKLTLWYLLILMCISVSFSSVIYKMLTLEFDRFANLQRARIETQFFNQGNIPESTNSSLDAPGRNQAPPLVELDLIAETKHRLVLQLAYLNGIIFIFAGGLSYFLAGRTLQPIQEMHEDQERFISDSSHELRTPLTAIKTTLEVSLRDKKLTVAEARKVMRESVEEVDQLQNLTENLLQLSQSKQQERTMLQELSLQGVIQRAVKQVKPLAQKKSIIIQEKIRNSNFYAYEAELVQLIVILLENAVKYSPEKTEVVIDAKKLRRTIRITVQDNGIGVDKDEQTHIFDRFYRSDKARTKGSAHGHGLGLSIAKQIVDLHGGQIIVKRNKPVGTVFTITIPTTL